MPDPKVASWVAVGMEAGMASNREPRARAATTAIFFLTGWVYAAWATRIPAIMVDLGLSEGELGVALPGLVDEPGVFERDAEASGERLQQLDVGVGESMLAIEVLEGDGAPRLVAGRRPPQPRRRPRR